MSMSRVPVGARRVTASYNYSKKGENMQYPNPCCRCGFCCLSETCPAGVEVHNIEKYDRCPGLQFDGDTARCQVFTDCMGGTEYLKLQNDAVLKLFGVGQGCCIKARAIKDDVEHDFASLPEELKVWCVRKTRGII